VPIVEAGRRADQRLEPLLRRWIAADLELEEIERLANLTDFYFCGIGLGFFAAADEVAADDAEHDADQDEHDEDLDQRHARHMLAGKIHFHPESVPIAWWRRESSSSGARAGSLDRFQPTSSLMPMTPSKMENTMP